MNTEKQSEEQKGSETVDRFESLLKYMEDNKFDQMSYEPGKILEIPSDLFLDFINFTAHAHKNLVTINTHFQQLVEVVNGYSVFTEQMLEISSAMQFRLMEKHSDNCEKGLTISKEAMDKIDALKKVKVKPEKK